MPRPRSAHDRAGTSVGSHGWVPRGELGGVVRNMGAYEDGYLLAESSGGDIYNSGGITEKIRFREALRPGQCRRDQHE